jgi:uncharacterized protein YlzI (FlbEa/FlbD family)
MKNLVLIFILALPFGVFSQEFAPIGAIWHNSQTTWINPELITYKTIESLSDTTINGMDCKKLIEVERFYSDTVNTFIHYMFSANDSVFFYKDNSFHLLYDFGAEAGDTIVLDYYLTSEGTPLLMIIDSTGTIDINGEQRKIQYVSCGDGIFIEFGGPMIEGIGSTYFLFPTYDGTVNGPLRCYQDEVIGLYINYFYSNFGWNYEDCNQIITDIVEPGSSNAIVTYPNPSLNRIYIKNPNPSSEYRINDINGNLIEQGQLDLSGEISIQDLTKGTYILQLITDNQVIVRKIIKN